MAAMLFALIPLTAAAAQEVPPSELSEEGRMSAGVCRSVEVMGRLTECAAYPHGTRALLSGDSGQAARLSETRPVCESVLRFARKFGEVMVKVATDHVPVVGAVNLVREAAGHAQEGRWASAMLAGAAVTSIVAQNSTESAAWNDAERQLRTVSLSGTDVPCHALKRRSARRASF